MVNFKDDVNRETRYILPYVQSILRWIERNSLSVLRQGLQSYYYLLEEQGRLVFLLNTTHAQTATLGEPYFVEKGKITGQEEIGPNRTQYSFTGNGTINGNIEVTDTGEFVSISKGDNLTLPRVE